MSDEPNDIDQTYDLRAHEARRIIEAVVLSSIEPVEPGLLAQLVELPVARIHELCAELADDYERTGRGFVLTRVAGGYRFQTHPELAPYVERFVLEGQHARLSAPALETLAIVAYKQPISRAQIAAIRGVDPESVLGTLLARGYVEEVGRDPGPGNAVMFGTSRSFLERLGLDSLADLPPLGDFVPAPDVVEALERGLRISDDPAPADAGANAGDEIGH
jgi:segregation and condensation protein B